MHNPNKLLLLRPKHFGFNDETAANNYFQKESNSRQKLATKAIEEHQNLTDLLSEKNIEFFIINDLEGIQNPDAVFLNNWFSIQPNGTMVIYPMWAKNRRSEIHPEQIKQITQYSQPKSIFDFSDESNNNLFCEGTGSLIFDHDKKLVYASVSERTTAAMVSKISQKIGYDHFTFRATDQSGNLIYHTNVLLSIGENIILLCSDAIENPIERQMLLKSLDEEGKVLINISFHQLNHFCANVLEVNNRKGEAVLLMSETAANNFTKEQLDLMQSLVEIAHCPIPTIEHFGGGSLRCLLARG